MYSKKGFNLTYSNKTEQRKIHKNYGSNISKNLEISLIIYKNLSVNGVTSTIIYKMTRGCSYAVMLKSALKLPVRGQNGASCLPFLLLR